MLLTPVCPEAIDIAVMNHEEGIQGRVKPAHMTAHTQVNGTMRAKLDCIAEYSINVFVQHVSKTY